MALPVKQKTLKSAFVPPLAKRGLYKTGGCALRLSPYSRLPQQREHSKQRLEDPQHGQEQVVRLHGQDPRGEAGVAGGHHEGAGAEEK